MTMPSRHRPPFAALITEARRLIAFGGGSAIGAAIDYAITMLAVSRLSLPPAVGLALAMLISATAVFVYHEKVTFPGAKSLHLWSRYGRFMALAAAVFALRAGALHLLLATGLSLPVALGIAIIAVSLINFAAASLLVFPRKPE